METEPELYILLKMYSSNKRIFDKSKLGGWLGGNAAFWIWYSTRNKQNEHINHCEQPSIYIAQVAM